MLTKATIDEFMHKYFQERTAALKEQMEIHLAFRRRFYHGGCLWGSRRNCVESSAAERILEVSISGDVAEVVTSGLSIYRSRYHLKSSHKSCLIHEVDTEYPGTGWRSWSSRTSEMRQLDGGGYPDEVMISVLEEPPGGVAPHDPFIDQFMLNHFHERTSSRKRELEIYSPIASRFYGPECQWGRWVPSVKASEAEKVVNVLPVNMGAYVITRGLFRYGLRYQLHPAAQGLLIYEVNVECPFCHRHGRRADCFWCGGTLWEHVKSKGSRAWGEPPDEETPPESIEGN
jgi:hypothetical protein